MAKTVTLDGIELSQIVLMKDRVSGKVLVRATYQVKSGSDVIKANADRSLTFPSGLGPTAQAPDLMTSQEGAAASAAWDAVVSALQRLEL